MHEHERLHPRTPYDPYLREAAADAVATLFSGTDWHTVTTADGMAAVNIYFTQFLALISGARLRIEADPLTWKQDLTSARPTTRSAEGAVIMKDNEQVHASLEFDDAKGFATVDASAVSWSVDDPTVCAAVPDTDGSGGCTFVAGNPGSAVATVTDGVVSGTVAIDVTAGDVASIKVTLGDPVPQPAA